MLDIIFIIIGGFISGAILGLIGAGSGIIAVMILMYLLNIPIHQAIAIALFNTALSATSGTIKNSLHKTLDLKIIISIFIPSLIFVPIGTQVGLLTSNILLEIIYASLTVMIGIIMWHNSRKKDLIAEQVKEISVSLRRKVISKYILIGSITGFLSGLLGFSGGIIIVPGLVILLNEPMKKATANSIAIIALTAYSSLISHYIMGNIMNYKIALLFSLGGISGVYLGAAIQSKSTDRLLKKIFAFFLIILGAILIIKKFTNFLIY